MANNRGTCFFEVKALIEESSTVRHLNHVIYLCRKECHCMLFLTPENDFAGEDQARPRSIIINATNSNSVAERYCLALSSSQHIFLTFACVLVGLQVISLEEIKDATSKY